MNNDFYTPEQRRAYNRDYYAANRDRSLAHKHRTYKNARFFWTRTSKGRVDATPGELWSLWHKQRGCCALTGVRLTRETAELDHRVARARGGSDALDNLRWVHKIVNRVKHIGSDDAIVEFLEAASAAALKRKHGTHYIIPHIRSFS